jgi:hypothetical protein
MQGGSASDDAGKVTASTAGLRLYRFFWGERNPRYYLGIAAAAVEATRKSSPFKTRGTAAGTFLGMELFWTRRVSFALDAGPYYLDIKENNTFISDSGVEFVADACVKVHFL